MADTAPKTVPADGAGGLNVHKQDAAQIECHDDRSAVTNDTNTTKTPDENDLVDTSLTPHFTSEYNKLREFRTREVHWNYYDSMHASKPTLAAKAAGTNSLEADNLDLYFKKTLSRSKFNSLDTFLAATTTTDPFAHFTPPFNQLLPLQHADGRWLDLPRVLKILKLSKDTRLEKATVWEMASAFVMALIRQRVEIFDELQPYHDRCVAHFPTSELIQQAKELILVNDMTLELKAVMKSRGIVDEDEDEDEGGGDENGRGEPTAEDIELEMLANQTWHPKIGGLLEHTNQDFSEDPFMQIPDQDAYAEMTARITKDTGALPIPAMTTMKKLSALSVLVHWDERPNSRSMRKKQQQGQEGDNDGDNEGLSENKEGEHDGQKDLHQHQQRSKQQMNPNPVEEVEEDYTLASDEEWATDSDDEQEGGGEDQAEGDPHDDNNNSNASTTKAVYGPVEEVDSTYELAEDEEWVTDSDEDEDEDEKGEGEGGGIREGSNRADSRAAGAHSPVSPQPQQSRGLSLASLGIARPGSSSSSSRAGVIITPNTPIRGVIITPSSSKPTSPEPAHRVSTPSKRSLRPGSSSSSSSSRDNMLSDTVAVASTGGGDSTATLAMMDGGNVEGEDSVMSSKSRGGMSVTFIEGEGRSLDTSVVLEGNEGTWKVEGEAPSSPSSSGQPAGLGTVDDVGVQAMQLAVPDEGVLATGDPTTTTAAAAAAAAVASPPLAQKRDKTAEEGAGALADRIRSLTPKKDEGKIKKKQRELDEVTIQAVYACEEIEQQVEKIKDCLARSIVDYNAALTQEERNTVFDELTTMLGDDAPPREGFLDWRKDGLPGMRPRCVKFFNLVHQMSILRLDLEELQTPGGRDPSKAEPPPLGKTWDWYDGEEADNADIWRWGFQWNGVDMVTKVLHCLDFLRLQKELAAWYGRSFWFTGNVLMLPFQMYTAYPALDMNNKIKERLMTKAHVRPACSVGGDGFTLVGVAPGSPTWEKCDGDIASLNAAQTWKHEKYLLRWRERFQDLCNGVRYSNWPNLPNLKLDKDNEAMYNCLMVLYIRCKKTLLTTYRWEKDFVSLVSTVRGAHLMMGESGLKPDLQLDRQVERRLIELKETAESERLQRIEDEKKKRKKKKDNASTGFLSSLMRQTKGPKIKRMTREELLEEMKKEERRAIFKRLITPKRDFGPEDVPGASKPPFEGWSSVNMTGRPGSPNTGFGRSPTRSPPKHPYWYVLFCSTFVLPSFLSLPCL
jgi:hypothetical protein